MRHPTILILLLLALPAAAQWKPEAKRLPDASAPDGKILEWRSPQGKPFLYRMPMERDRNKPNLILMLHGTGMTYPWAFGNYQVVAQRYRPRDIIVAPEGMTPGSGNTFNFVQGKADGEQIAALIKLFKSHHEIGKVYLYGHSQGAFFCYWFAGEFPELVDGIVAHAGNVLQVRHPKLAKKKVAIGILHGRADAVVPVECAVRTEKVYRDQGYEMVKLLIVEGLTGQSGHWPLPRKVNEMFEWLDRVCADDPGVLISQAESALRSDSLDLAVVTEALGKAAPLLKRSKDEELDQRAARLNTAVANFASVHATHLEGAETKLRGRWQLGPWVGYFHAAAAGLRDHSAFQRPIRALHSAARKQSKKVSKVLRALEKSPARGFRPALKSLAQDFLAMDYPALLDAMDALIAAAPKGLSAKHQAEARALIDAGRKALAEGQAQFNKQNHATLKQLNGASTGG